MNNRFHVGDTVSFLNEKQDGKVLALRSDGTVTVEIEAGFTIDAQPSELVLIKRQEHTEKKTETASFQPENKAKVDLHSIARIVHDEQLALLIVPDPEKINSGPLDLFLVNKSDWKVLYSFGERKSNLIKGLACGIAEPRQSAFLLSIPRNEVNTDGPYLLECLFFSDSPQRAEPRYFNDNLVLPVPGIVQSAPDLPRPWSFAQSHVIRNFLAEEPPVDQELLKKFADEYRQPIRKSADKQVKNSRQNKLQDGLGPEIEIDLHIEEIKPDTSGMSNTQIIDFQMSHFRYHLDRAILLRQRSIVFIHGIGNGRLRNLIREELKNLGLQFTDAPFHRYGAGATEVIL